MAFLEFGEHNIQTIKLVFHILQSALIVISWVLEIIVFRKAKSIDGRPGWYFGLCFLSIPAIIFLTMTLRYNKSRKYAQPYALATVDFLMAIMWLAAFASQASYNGSGKCNGACGASKAIVGFGVVIWICWVFTTIFSLYGVLYWKREGYLPGASRAPYNAQQIDPDKEAFSTAPHNDEYAAVHDADEHEIPAYAGPSGSTGSRFDSGYGNPSAGIGAGGYVQPHVQDEYTGYTGAGRVDEHDGRVQFPDARY